MARTSFNDVVNSFARWRLDLFQRGLSFVWAISCSSARSGKGFLVNRNNWPSPELFLYYTDNQIVK